MKMQNDCFYCLLSDYCKHKDEQGSEHCHRPIKTFCWFCYDHYEDDELYEIGDCSDGYNFNAIKHIRYCPLCGRKLQSDE